jgi:CRP-like cAMP-binding protein
MITIMSTIVSALTRMPGRELRFAPGQSLFLRGDRVRLLHLVRRGTVHLIRHQEDGSALVLQRAREGSVLAEASLWATVHHCDARSESEAVTWSVACDVARSRVAGDPVLAAAWAEHLAIEVQRARLRAEILSLKTVAARLSAWHSWNGSLPPKGQWALLGLEIGVSPESLYRELARRRGKRSRSGP